MQSSHQVYDVANESRFKLWLIMLYMMTANCHLGGTKGQKSGGVYFLLSLVMIKWS